MEITWDNSSNENTYKILCMITIHAKYIVIVIILNVSKNNFNSIVVSLESGNMGTLKF